MERARDIATPGSSARIVGGLLEIRVLSDVTAVVFSTEAATISAAALAAGSTVTPTPVELA